MSVKVLRKYERVLIDTSIWIYHFEQHPQFGPAAGEVIADVEDGRFRAVASELTLLELTVKPLQTGRQDVADDYELLLSYFPNLQLEPISREILLDAAALRARHRLRTPDAILLATGLQAGATAAVTNDASWHAVSGIKVVVLSELGARMS